MYSVGFDITEQLSVFPPHLLATGGKNGSTMRRSVSWLMLMMRIEARKEVSLEINA
jgi:hypothetical protein